MSVISAVAICFLIYFNIVYSVNLEWSDPDYDLTCYENNRNRTLEWCSVMMPHKEQDLDDFCRKEQDYYGCLFSKMYKFCGDHSARLMVKSVPLSLGKEATGKDDVWDDYHYPKCAKLVDMWDKGASPALSISSVTYALAVLLWIV